MNWKNVMKELQLESDKTMFKKHILQVKKQIVANQSDEQYGRSQWLRLQGVTIERQKTSNECYQKYWLCIKNLVWISLIQSLKGHME